MRSSISILALAALLPTTLARTFPRVSPRQTTNSTGVASATWDGTCFYPVGDTSFPGLSDFTGRWYQVAGTVEVFTLGCSCTYAEYTLLSDTSISVTNACQLGLLSNVIEGTATAVDSAYGTAALQVSFDSVPGGGVICPGPNYVVQKYTSDWAIVQGPDFSSLFLLSREQNPADADIDSWLAEAEALGSNLSLVTKVSQTDCLYT